MKPFGKTMKTATISGVPQDKALSSLLANYRSTPHVSTKEAPGNMLLRGGFRTHFPQTPISEADFAAAKDRDRTSKQERQDATNSSPRRTPHGIKVGDMVLNFNHNRKSKFDPLFEPFPYKVVQISGTGVVLEQNGKQKRRHVDDVKLMTYKEEHQGPHSENLYFWDNPIGFPCNGVGNQATAAGGTEESSGEEVEAIVQEVIRQRDQKRAALELSTNKETEGRRTGERAAGAQGRVLVTSSGE